MKLLACGLFAVAVILACDLAYRTHRDREADKHAAAVAVETQKREADSEERTARLSAWKEGVSRIGRMAPQECRQDFLMVKTFEWPDAQLVSLSTVKVKSFLHCYDTKTHQMRAYPWSGTAVRADEPGHWYMDDLSVSPTPVPIPPGSHVRTVRD